MCIGVEDKKIRKNTINLTTFCKGAKDKYVMILKGWCGHSG